MTWLDSSIHNDTCWIKTGNDAEELILELHILRVLRSKKYDTIIIRLENC